MEASQPVSRRGLLELLQHAIAARAEGLVLLRDDEGLRHGVWVEQGYVVGAHMAGRFDPLLELLRQHGALSDAAHRRCLAALYEGRTRSGHIARALAGVESARVCDVLKGQLVARFRALLAHANSHGHDTRLERGPVPSDERSVRVPLASLLRRSEHARVGAPGAARKRLRELARALHPDRHGHLDDAMRERLTSELASATAMYHGFR